MPLSLLVEPLELASDAVQNIPSETRTKKFQQKNERQDKDGRNSDIRKSNVIRHGTKKMGKVTNFRIPAYV